MKKLFVLVILLLSICTHAQTKIKLIDIPNVEVGILLNVNEKNSFSELYVFQYSQYDLSKLLTAKSITLVDSDKDHVRLNVDENIYLFSLNPKLQKSNETLINGYGLSHRSGNYSISLIEKPTTVTDDLLLNGVSSVGKARKCDSGGAGSSECMTSAGALGGGSQCSVKCNKGYYSCCNDNVNECTCVKG
jgi:hypothetical protein